MKLSLDPSLPEWHRVPVCATTLEPWAERQQELLDLAMKGDRAGFDALVERTEFQETPYFQSFHRIENGALSEKQWACHPATWERMEDEERALFAVDGADAAKA